MVPAVGFTQVPLDVNTSLLEPGGIAPQLATVPSVVRYSPALPDCEGSVPSKAIVLALIVPSVIHALFEALRFFHTGSVPLVSIQS
jgi:hypothetical protein